MIGVVTREGMPTDIALKIAHEVRRHAVARQARAHWRLLAVRVRALGIAAYMAAAAVNPFLAIELPFVLSMTEGELAQECLGRYLWRIASGVSMSDPV